MADSKVAQTTLEAWRSLINAVLGLYKLAPAVVFAAVLVSVFAIKLFTMSAIFMTGLAILIVVVVAIIVFGKTKSYGEAALALVAGLLPALTVEWTPPLFAGFVAAWLLFSVAALLIASVRLAAISEELFVQAALSMADPSSQSKSIERQLKAIADSTEYKVIGPLRRAEVLRHFAFRGLPIEAMSSALKATEMLATITKVDNLKIASMFADMYLVAIQSGEDVDMTSLDHVYEIIRTCPASPKEFIEAFQDAKRLVLAGDMSFTVLLDQIRQSLAVGIPPSEMYQHLSMGTENSG